MENKTIYVAGFMFTPDKLHVVLIKKLKPEWQKGKLNGIGGKVEPGEDISDAMVREFKEETGIETVTLDWWKFAVLSGPTWEVHFFECEHEEAQNAKTMEEEAVGLYEVQSLIPLYPIIPNLRWLIPAALDPDDVFLQVEYNK